MGTEPLYKQNLMLIADIRDEPEMIALNIEDTTSG
jgi:hypothetical protein